MYNGGTSPPDAVRVLCSDSSPEKPDTYLNVESGDVPTDTATSGLVTGPDKFRLLGGLEPSPELIAISIGNLSPCVCMYVCTTQLCDTQAYVVTCLQVPLLMTGNCCASMLSSVGVVAALWVSRGDTGQAEGISQVIARL